MSDTGSNDPYDPNRPSQPDRPDQPQWGSTPPPPAPGGQPQYGAPGGQPQYGQPQYGAPGQYGGYGQPAGTPPPNYLVWAILSTILCCLPLGIASIVFAAQVNSKWSAGDVAGAQESSRKARQFAIWSAAAGVLVIAIYLVFVVVAISSDSSS